MTNREDAMRRHPAGSARRPHLAAEPDPVNVCDEDGSLIAEYGLLAVIAATIAGVVMQWASQGTRTAYL